MGPLFQSVCRLRETAGHQEGMRMTAVTPSGRGNAFLAGT
ncbi:hypothetical protein DesfrDRAFT_3805 [Solidesulfovibrio fructosivorans JJ]]|uniref:Uncharacterized protein n=1 Tax=Solidesulfovibrio fructosivorans JJ] TaxID=596151 RepID=E1K1Q5_SOLFR|nr:hypothetical protein DesfrDRAFT_3805 [Solidesulfovibrio fructosivorans JJ]]